jgi:protocatechuate 3,4-dioxygenase beta subunit
MLRALASLATAAAVIGLGLSASGASAQARCQPTESDVIGPFVRLDAPRRAKIGTGHVLRGRILGATNCQPVRGAVVTLWQAGPNGYVYRPRGRGSVVTDRSGRFRFEGPVPATSGFRPPHIHIAVSHPAYEELLTRYVVRRGAKTGRITLVLTPFL